MVRTLCINLLFFFHLCANPTGESVVSGNLNINCHKNQLDIHQTSKKAIIEWKDFSIELGERVNIYQKFSDGAILNRVVGNYPSKILGTLESNGSVYLINEHGILIGKQGEIQTKGFLASCLNLKNEHFLNSKTLFFEGDKQGEFVNFGSIKTSKENIFLFAQVIKNEGKIHAQKGNVHLVGANQLYLTKDNQIFVNAKSIGTVENKGSIKAIEAHLEAAGGCIYSCAINQAGVIEANGVEKLDGKIILKAHSNLTNVSGSLASQSQDKGGSIHVTGGDEIHLQDTARLLANGNLGGGEILIGGDYQGKNPNIENTKKVWVNKKAIINADAISQGNGGKVVVWADEQNLFGGTISAKGGLVKGDGGFIEVSSKEYLLYKGSSFTNAFNGKIGNLLLDPSDITISTSASSPSFPTSPGNYNPTGASATLNVSDLVNVTDGLGNNNVTISTSGGTGGSGIVTFANDVTWSANTTLTVLADQSIIVNSGVNLSNTSTASNFTAFDFRGNEAGGSTANSIGIDIVGSITTVNGNINLVGQGGTSASNFGVYLRNTSTGLSSSGSGANAGTITIDGTGGSGASDCYGAYIQGSGDRITSIDGNISVTGVGGGDGTSTNNIGILMSDGAAVRSTGTTADAATITFDGTGGSGTSNNHGIEITGTNCGISSSVGNISLIGAVDAPSGSTNYGIYINSAGFIESTGTTSDAATITLNGTGGGSSAGRGITFLEVSSFTSVNGDISLTGVGTGAGVSSDGIVMRNTTISSTGTGASAANITIDGTSNGSAGSGCELFTSSGAISVAGNISVSGTGASPEQGFDMTSASSFIGNGSTQGDITIIANTINLAGDVQSSGVLTIQPDTVAGTIGLGDASSGTLNLTNTELSNIQDGFSEIIFGRTDGTGAIDVRAFTYTDPITIQSLSGTITINGALAAGTNAITLSSDSMAIDNSVTGTSTLTIQPGQASTTIGLGTGATGTLNLTDTELGNLTDGFSSITFGSTTGTGAVDMQAFTYSDPIIVYGGTISVNGIVATGGADDIIFNIGSAGAGTLNLNANVNAAGTFTVNGGANNDAFNINVTSQTATLVGNGGTNTLTGPNASNTWIITSDNGGTLNTSIGFSGMQNLTGNASNDAFTFNGAFQIAGTIDGSTGTNTITGPNVNNAWSVTSTDTGSITPTGAGGATSFSNIGNLTGGSSNDTFTLSDGVGVSGAIDGTSSTGNSLSYAAYTTSVSVNLQTGAATNITGGVSNIQTFTGGSNTDTVTGTNTTNAWTITADNTSSLNNGSTTFTLNSFENLTGGSGGDAFTFNGAFQITGAIDGSTGTNTITGPNVNNAWAVTSTDTGSITPTGAGGATSFSNIGNLTGGSSNDTFTLSDGVGVSGAIDGTSSTGNSLSYAAYTTSVSVNLQTGAATNITGGVSNIQTFTGGSNTDTVTGTNTTNTWNITANNTSSLNNGSTTFTLNSFENLTGGTGNDSFILSDGVGVSGAIDGTSSTGNSLSYAAYTTSVSVNLQTGAATNITGGVSNIQTFTGGSNTDTVTGTNTTNTWNITANNTSSLNNGSTTFTLNSFENLTGGTGGDSFILSDGVGVSGAIDGTSSTGNSLSYAAYTTGVSVNLQTGAATNITGGISNIQTLTGGSNADTITGTNTTNAWTITADDTSSLNNGSTTFTLNSFENLTGGTGNDTFTFNGAFQITGSIDGSIGTNTLAGPNVNNAWVITADNAGSVTPTGAAGATSFSNIGNLTGGAGNDTFTFNGAFQIAGVIDGSIGTNTLAGPNVNNAWAVTSTDTGSITPTGAGGATSFSNIGNLTGGSSNDTFTLSDGVGVSGAIDGTSSTGNSLSYAAYTTGVSVNLQTGAATNITGGVSNIQTFTGGSNTDTVTGTNTTNTWNITANNTSSLNNGSTTFTLNSFENLTGGTGGDSFILSDGVGVSGAIDGTSSTGNSLSYAAYTTSVSVNLQTGAATNITGGVSNIQTFTGGSNTDTVTGTNTTNAWTITADDTSSLNNGSTTFTLNSFENLTGGSGSDAFTFNGAFQITGAIDGSTGTNTITGPNVNNAWAVTSTDTGSITPTGAGGATSFSNIGNLTGGSSNDTFTLSDGVGVSGAIDGISSTGNSLSYAAYTTGVSVNLQTGAATNITGGVSNIQTFTGGSNTDTVTGTNTTNAWTITADNTSSLNNGSTTFTLNSFENLTGGSGNDTFTFNGAFQITGAIDGSTGTNTIIGPNVNNAWAVTSTDTGSITPTGAGGATSFSNIGNLTGGSSNDTFTLSDGVGVSGAIDGTSSTGNSLSYAAYTTSVSVNLQTGAATNITGGVSNIQTFTGGSNADTITGTNTTNAWTITADDTSSLNNGSTTFTLNSFENLTGGTGNDTFIFNGAFQITGAIDGSTGSNTINGPNVNNIWAVTSQTTGTLTPTGASGTTNYSNIGSLVGNASDDTFNLSPDITLPSIAAGAGTDTLNFLVGWTTPASINLNTVAGFEVINGPPGLDNTLVGNNLDNTWTITAADAGTLENTDYPLPTVFTFSNFPNITGGSANDTFDFTAGFTVTSIDGSTGSNTLLAPNAVNTWNITDDNTGSVASISFANITDLTGGTLSDTFVFANQKGVTGQVDGGAPASLNTLDYSAFSPAAIVVMLTSTSGTASNLGSGYINIGNIIGNITSGAAIATSVQQKSNFYFANLQLLFTELYHCRLIPEFFYRQFEKMKYVQEPQERIQIRRKNK